jgi:hypothetical protein
MNEEEFANKYFESVMGVEVDKYMEEMIDKMEPLKDIFDKAVEKRLEEINHTCESCGNKPVERFYRYDDFNDFIADLSGEIKCIIHMLFLCEECCINKISSGELEVGLYNHGMHQYAPGYVAEEE